MTPFGFLFTFSPLIFLLCTAGLFVTKRFLPELWKERLVRLSLQTLIWGFGVVSLPILLGWIYVFVWVLSFGASV